MNEYYADEWILCNNIYEVIFIDLAIHIELGLDNRPKWL